MSIRLGHPQVFAIAGGAPIGNSWRGDHAMRREGDSKWKRQAMMRRAIARNVRLIGAVFFQGPWPA
jgi:hypothetical protein